MNRPRYIHGTPRPSRARGTKGTVRANVRQPSEEVSRQLSRAVFLDRDGTIMDEVNYCARPDQVMLIDGAREALARLRRAGYLLFIITNQSGIGRGLLSEREFHSVQHELLRQLGDGIITRTYFCPDPPGTEQSRRKPSPRMVFEAMREHAVDPRRSWFIGDKAIDMTCGRRAGLHTILVRSGHGAGANSDKADHVAETIVEAVDRILAHE